MSSLWHLSKLNNLEKHLLTTHKKMQVESISLIDSLKKVTQTFFLFNIFEGENVAITKTVNKGIFNSFPFLYFFLLFLPQLFLSLPFPLLFFYIVLLLNS